LISTQAQTFSNSFYATTEGKTSTHSERQRKLASLTFLDTSTRRGNPSKRKRDFGTTYNTEKEHSRS